MVNKVELSDVCFQERFWSKVEKTEECWHWIGAVQSKGYGSISISGKTYSAHRVSYEIKYGKIPYGMYVLHRCDNTRCVNPEHLFLGTARDNSQDMVVKGRMSKLSGYRKVTRDQVEQIRLQYQTKEFSYRVLGDQFKISHSSIGSIIRYESWKNN
jgi:hypothetical protein